MVEKVGYSRPATGTRPANSTRRTSAAGGVEFAQALARAEGAGGVDGVDHIGGVAGIGSAGALLGIQEVSEEEVRRKRALKRGRLTLDALSNLRDALLTGSLPMSTLRQLEQLVAEERAQVPDPLLHGILDEIELRAAVELAKLEMSGAIPPR